MVEELEHTARPSTAAANRSGRSPEARLRLLGPVTFQVAGEVVLLSPQQRRLLAAIAVGPGMRATTAELIDRVWGAESPANAHKLLQGIVLRIRRSLGTQTTQEHLRTTTIGYELRDVGVDLDDFAAAVQASRSSATPSQHLKLLAGALSLWHGPPYGEYAGEEWATVDAARLDALHIEAQERYAAALLALGREAETIPLLEAATRSNPLHEPYWALLISALHRCGRKADALDAYQRARSWLVDELGIEPGSTLRNLEHAVLVDDEPDGGGSDDLGQGQPIATVLEPRPLRVPRPRTSFVGRDQALRALGALIVGGERLVTLTGPGGSGKTRLAIELAHALVRDRSIDADSVSFADLSVLRSGIGVVEVVGQAVGMPPGALQGDREAVEESLLRFLRARRCLVVLDNCEHLRSPAADLADRLLTHARQVSLLATSREPLRVDGEQQWRVDPLAVPDQDGGAADSAGALQLLVDRVRAVHPGFELTSANRRALIDICRRLDGLPLGLELAAGRAAHLSPSEIAHRLGERLDILAGAGHPARHETVTATIAWSYELLAPDEQRMLRALSVFPVTFTADAVVGVSGRNDVEVIDLLGSLVDRSVVVADTSTETTRYRLLEPIRAFASDRLDDAGETAGVRDAHRDWLLEGLEAKRLDVCLLDDDWAAELHARFDHLRAALTWSQQSGRLDLLRRVLLRIPCVFARYGHMGEARPWFELAVDYEATSLPPEEWLAHVIVEWNNTHRLSGSPSDHRRSLARVERLLARSRPDSFLAAAAHMTRTSFLSTLPRRVEELEESAIRTIEEAEPDYPFIANTARWYQATSYLYRRRYGDAVKLLESVGEPEIESVNTSLAVTRLIQGRPHSAIDRIDRCRPTLDLDTRAQQIIRAAATAALDNSTSARAQLARVVEEVRDSGWEHPLARSDCLIGFATVAALDGNLERASTLIAAVPNMASSGPHLFVLLRHHRDQIRNQLDDATRRECIQTGRAMSVDEALDQELTRQDRDASGT